MEAGEQGCFLCKPDPALVYMEQGEFFAMLGLGPIGEGYSLIASRGHQQSMLDLTEYEATQLAEFTQEVRDRLGPLFGECSIGEHGRVALCVGQVTVRHEPHCMHAHRLVFPGLSALPLRPAARGATVESFKTFRDAHANFRTAGQYLYAENADGTCEVAAVPRAIPRQQLRRLAANLRQESPDLANWQDHPSLELVKQGKSKLSGR